MLNEASFKLLVEIGSEGFGCFGTGTFITSSFQRNSRFG